MWNFEHPFGNQSRVPARMKTLALLVCFLALVLGSCASGVIMMQDPKTGQVFRCERNALAPLADYNANEDCARGVERAGWKRL